jgi:hypothetical protein
MRIQAIVYVYCCLITYNDLSTVHMNYPIGLRLEPFHTISLIYKDVFYIRVFKMKEIVYTFMNKVTFPKNTNNTLHAHINI